MLKITGNGPICSKAHKLDEMEQCQMLIVTQKLGW